MIERSPSIASRRTALLAGYVLYSAFLFPQVSHQEPEPVDEELPPSHIPWQDDQGRVFQFLPALPWDYTFEA